MLIANAALKHVTWPKTEQMTPNCLLSLWTARCTYCLYGPCL